jgi:uncharacterized protein YhdP
MPELDIQVNDFALGNKHFGELNILATAKDNTWILQKLNVKNPNGIFNATGKWEFKANNEPSRTYLDFVVTSNNTGELLSSLGYAEVLANGKSNLSGAISWAGAPFAFSTKTLNGNLKFDVENGKVLQVDSTRVCPAVPPHRHWRKGDFHTGGSKITDTFLKLSFLAK